MTSDLPPKITPTQAGTPPTDWASETKSMSQSDVVTPDPTMKATPKTEHPITTTTNLTAPGQEFPGSYPRELEQELQQQSHGDESEGPAAASSVVQTEKQDIPEPGLVERTIGYASQAAIPIRQGVKNTVASYWPNDNSQPQETKSEFDQKISTSLPSSELKGAQPHEHVGGVGSLPGTISESSVALLPDERAWKNAQRPEKLEKDESQTRDDNQPKSTFLPGAAAVAAKPEDLSSPAESSQHGTQIDPQQLEKPPTQQSDLYPAKLSDIKPVSVDHTPKHEVLEGQRSDDSETADVGSAAVAAAQIRDQPPGKITESKVPKTAEAGGAVGAGESPKEADVEDKARDNKEVPSHGQGAKVPQQPGDEELKKNKSVENRKGDSEGKVTGDRGSDEDTKHTHRAGARIGGYETDYHPAKLHPPRVVESTSQAEVQSESPVSPASAPPASVADSPKEHRVSFLDKLRGEAKIIAGKMSGKDDKVEEGKRIMHGGV